MQIISRKEALSAGLKSYFTGKPCKHGHLSNRKTSNHECCECSRARNRDWFKNNPDKDKIKSRIHYEKHRERIIEKSRLYYSNNKDAVLKRVADYQKANPHICIASVSRRRDRISNSLSHFTAADVDMLLFLQKNQCAICSKKFGKNRKYHVDHIFPLSKGGSNSRDNIQILCANCNHKKAASDPIDYANKLGKLL